jgi:hypothetical protein
VSLPSKARVRAESVVALKSVSPSPLEARQAATACRDIANDSEVSPEVRNRFSEHAHALAAPPTADDASRRETQLMAASLTARANL